MLLSLASIIFSVYYINAQTPPTTIQTEYGAIRGFLNFESRVFRSIPYAAPPVGDLRWVNPQPPKSWTNTKDCTAEVVGCPQHCSGNPPLTTTECPEVQSEDCLYLNIWTPLTVTPTSSLPVLVWIHGGSFRAGYGGGLLYNGSRMVNETDVVVVTINYRLGALGSLWDKSLGLQGNYGYLDQVFAIEFVYRNIKNFGGDPQHIILFGQSAGAHSVALHLLNKTSLISGGIMESPPLGLPLRTEISWGTLPDTFSEQLGCKMTLSPTERLSCLRSTNASQVVVVQGTSNNANPQTGFALIKGGMPWTPTVGPNTIIIDQPLIAFRNGDYNTHIPFMGGTNSGEAFLYTSPEVTYESLTHRLVEDLGQNDATKVEEFYNITIDDKNENLFELSGNISTDFWFRCPTRNVFESSVKFADSSSNIGYFYHFTYIASFVKHVWYWQPECWTHVCHEEELPFVFNPNGSAIDVYPTAQEILLADQLQFYWTDFAQTGDPSTGKHQNNLNQKWLNYGSNTEQRTLMINGVGENGIIMQNAPDDQICDFWDNLGYNWYNGTV